jgi:signal transduction histidine kinase
MRWPALSPEVHPWADLTWRRAAMVGGICFVLATHILFQNNIFEFAPADTLESFIEYFLEIAAVGFAVLLLVVPVHRLLPEEGARRSAALTGAVLGGVFIGMTAGLAVRYGMGPYPSALFVAGEFLRWTILAGVVTFIHEMQLRDEAASREAGRIEIEGLGLARRRMEARVQLMQAQIEPHFLFNTLATVKRLYRTGPAAGARMLDSLMQYLRAALPRLREEEATLGDEMDHVAAYLDILCIRMGDKLRHSIEAAPNVRAVRFPSMMLITLVENAVKHGIAPKPEGGSIAVLARLAGRRLLVEVRDTGVGFQASSGSGIGLANTRARLDAVFGANAELSLEPNEPAGVVARIEADIALPAGARA